MKTIESIVEDEICTGCGACVALCPKKAMRLVTDKKRGIYFPEIDKNKCNNCRFCLEVCPRYKVNFEKLNLEIFGKKPEDTLIGNYLNCYTGYAKNYDIRYNASSGGLVTALLIFALEKGIINGTLNVRMKKNKPLEPESFIARTPEEILLAKGSKYCPVSITQGLKEIMRSKEKEKFAVVGLPCHIQAVRKIEKIDNNLKRKIILHFGLFCNHTPNFCATETLLTKLKIKKEEITKLDYRGEGWPGYMKIFKRNGNIRLFLPDYWNFLGSDFFTSTACLMCSDHTAELSDISFGDAWLPEFIEDKVGTSIVISRTPQGEEILQKAMQKGVIQLNSISSDKIIASQIIQTYLKKKNIGARMKLFRKKIYLDNILKADLLDYPLSLFSWVAIHLSRCRFFPKLIKYLPLKFFSLYNRFVNFLYYKKAQSSFKKYISRETESRNEIKSSKVTKVVITNYGNRLNKGTSALLHSQIRALKNIIPDAKFYVFTYHPEIKSDLEDKDLKILEIIGKFSKRNFFKNWKTLISLIKCSLWWFLYRYFRLDIKKLRNGRGLSEYYSADVIIDTGGDNLTEDYGTPVNIIINLLFGVLLNKPVVIYAESIGSFNRWYNKILVKFLLNRTKLITLREEISKTNVEELGIKEVPIYVTADPAFILEPASNNRIKEILEKEKIKNNKPLVGISVSKLFSRYEFHNFTSKDKYQNYIDLMAKIVDYLTDAFNTKVVFVPHVISSPRNDDRAVADEICEIVKNGEKIISIKNEYTPEELKGVIGRCDLFIGARMHACIAATSMYVPTIAIAYSQKAWGIIGQMLGYKDFVLGIENLDFNDLKSVVDKAWYNRKKIKEELKVKLEDVKKRALLNAKLTKKIIDKEKFNIEKTEII